MSLLLHWDVEPAQGALPLGRRRRDAVVSEGRVRPVDAGVEEADDGALPVPGDVPPEPGALPEPEKLRRVRGHELERAVRERAHEPRLLGHRVELGVGEPGREAAEGLGVGMHEARLAGVGEGGGQEGLVPQPVGEFVSSCSGLRRWPDEHNARRIGQSIILQQVGVSPRFDIAHRSRSLAGERAAAASNVSKACAKDAIGFV